MDWELGVWGGPAPRRAAGRRLACVGVQHDADRFAAARAKLPEGFPSALATMWTWITESRTEADRMLEELASRLRREPDELRGQVCVGSADHCTELLSRYRDAGCERVYFWPLGDEPRQIELIAAAARPL